MPEREADAHKMKLYWNYTFFGLVRVCVVVVNQEG